MIRKCIWTIFFHALLIIVTKTEGGLITGFNKFHLSEKDVSKNDDNPTTNSQNCLSTTCCTRRSVVTMTRVDDQTVNPNLDMKQFTSFTPRTRTQQRSTSRGTMCPTKKWKCNGLVEDEPATEQSNTVMTTKQNMFTLPTRQPKYPTPIDPITKWFLQMTSTNKWRTRPADICTSTKPTI